MFILIGGLLAFLVPVIPLAVIILSTGQKQFRASTTDHLKQRTEKARWFWFIRAVLHVVTAGLIGYTAYRQQISFPILQLLCIAVLGTALHYGVHIIQGISLKSLFIEQRAYDIPIFMIAGVLAGYYLGYLIH